MADIYKEDQVIVYDNNSENWKDVTNSVRSITELDNKFKVEFKSGRKYNYSKNKVSFSSIDLKDKFSEFKGNQKVIINSNGDVIEVDKATLFKNGILKIKTEKGYKFLKYDYDKRSDLFNYFYSLAYEKANDTQVKNDGEKTSDDFLLNQYKKIKHINSDSVLNYYFQKGSLSKFGDQTKLIFPFDFNLSQKDAIQNALDNRISLIEGPPGCGKTQTILNFIANAVLLGKTVCVVSNNNTAINNVKQKLDDKNIGFFAAMLGKNENKELFFNSDHQSTVDSFYKNNPKRLLNFFSFNKNLKKLDFLYSTENNLKIKKLQLSELEKEYEHFKRDKNISFDGSIYKKANSNSYLKAKFLLEHKAKVGFFLRRRLKKLLKIDFKEYDSEKIINLLADRFYQTKIVEFSNDILKFEQILNKNNFSSLKDIYKKNSFNLFVNKLYDVSSHKDSFTIKDYKSKFDEFIKRFPLILSTTYSILVSIPDDFMFDYIIFDEASQSDLLSSVVAFNYAKNLVVVGDSKQLPEIDEENLLTLSDELSKIYKIPKEYQYKDNSVLSSVNGVFGNSIRKTILKEHYRCNPKIINFCNQRFYNNELIIMTDEKKNAKPFKIIYTDFSRNFKKVYGEGNYNQREIDEIKEYIINDRLRNLDNEKNDIGIISPFRLQSTKIQEVFKGFNNKIKSSTVHSFQGQERNEIILSIVLDEIGGNLPGEKPEFLEDFVNNPALMNVAISRAKNKLVLVTSKKIYESKNKNLITDLIKYIEYYDDSAATKGNLSSVFEFLYNQNSKEYIRLKKKTIGKKQNQAEEKIREILLNKIKNSGFNFRMHVSLPSFIKTFDNFSDSESRYLKNRLTHVDFLIYRNIAKEPCCAIEVDGFKFHENNRKQREHDNIKTRCLNKNGIKLLRLPTNGSGEIEKIENMIKQLRNEYNITDM